MATTEMALFDRSSVQDPQRSSGWIKTVRIQCGACGETASIPANVTGGLPPEAIRKKFQGLKWIVGQRKSGHRCPNCSHVRAAPPPAQPPPPKAVISTARRRADTELDRLCKPPEMTPSYHATCLAEARALLALAQEACQQIDEETRAVVARAEETKRALLDEVDALRKRLLA